MGGGGDAWTRDHDKILEHARGLHYDHVPGVTLPDAVNLDDYTAADKEGWISAMDDFNAWKAREVPKEASGQAWWQTYPASLDDSPGDGGGGGGGGDDTGGPLLGPYPKPNEYFPMLTTEYTRPSAYDEGYGLNYVPNWIQQGPFPGLLYQPGTQEYYDAFPMDESILSYQPNKFGVGDVLYNKPMTALEIVHEEEGTDPSTDDEYDWENDPEGRKGGKDPEHDPTRPTGKWEGWAKFVADLGELFGGDDDPSADVDTSGNEAEYGAGSYGMSSDPNLP